MQHYQDHYELIYADSMIYDIDMDLKSLGITSNRDPQILGQLIKFLKDPEKKDMAGKLLNRYCAETFETVEQWEKWHRQNRKRIYFSDCGGYKFRVVPKGYL